MSTAREAVARGIATALLGGAWQPSAMTRRVRVALGRDTPPAWVRELVRDVAAAYRDPPVDRPLELARYLRTRPAWDAGWAPDAAAQPRIVRLEPQPTRIARARWPLAPLDDLAAVARLLAVDQGELGWFADLHGLEATCSQALRHYRWLARRKRGGFRLVAAPKPRLKELQRRMLRHVLAAIPVHEAAHGAVAGRSVRSAVLPHAGAETVIRIDLEAFYPSIPAARVWGLLRTAGLPEAVAHVLTGTMTTVVPRAVWTALPRPGPIEAFGPHERLAARLRVPHLPQGAPTSPRLANLVAFSLDRRLDGLAASFGARYTRYVDDLTFSGGRSLRARRSVFVGLVERIVRAEGFAVNERKTAVLGAAGRQSLLGAVVNDHPTLPRAQRDALRALLHNCTTHGWRSQTRGRPDFPAHVLGRIGWAAGLDPAFGARLRASYDAIDWS